MIGGPLVQVGQVGLVFRLVLEELIDVFDGFDAKFGFCDLGKVQVVQFAGEQGLVQRPFGQRDLEQRALARRPRGRTAPRGPRPLRHRRPATFSKTDDENTHAHPKSPSTTPPIKSEIALSRVKSAVTEPTIRSGAPRPVPAGTEPRCMLTMRTVVEGDRQNALAFDTVRQGAEADRQRVDCEQGSPRVGTVSSDGPSAGSEVEACNCPRKRPKRGFLGGVNGPEQIK